MAILRRTVFFLIVRPHGRIDKESEKKMNLADAAMVAHSGKMPGLSG